MAFSLLENMNFIVGQNYYIVDIDSLTNAGQLKPGRQMIGPLRFEREFDPEAEGIGVPLDNLGPRLEFVLVDNQALYEARWNARAPGRDFLFYRREPFVAKVAMGGRKKSRKAKKSGKKTRRR